VDGWRLLCVTGLELRQFAQGQGTPRVMDTS
jgi:hypothetical protein